MSGDRRELNFTNVEIYQVFQSAKKCKQEKRKKRRSTNFLFGCWKIQIDWSQFLD